MLHDLRRCSWRCVFFFFNDTATTEIYTLSLHDALPISWAVQEWQERQSRQQDPLTVLPLLTAEGIRRATQLCDTINTGLASHEVARETVGIDEFFQAVERVHQGLLDLLRDPQA